MNIRFRHRLLLGLPITGIVILSGCSSQSSSPSPTTTADASKTASAPAASPTQSTEPSDTTSADAAAAPQRKPPPGLGNAIGRVLFDGKGAPDIEVRLCQDIGLVGGCSGATYNGRTNKDGYYIVDKVKPGDYSVAVRVFNTNSFIYPTGGILSAAKFKVEKDESLAVRTVNLWKTNLQVVSPKTGGTVNSSKPKLTWKAYPDAAKYKVSIHTKGGVGTLTTLDTSDTSMPPDKPLLNGNYQWKVEAFNGDGTKIAETADDSTFKVTGQAGSNTVELMSPRPNASVGAAGLTLQWKPNPLAQEYHVYLKGLKAKESLLSFISVNGTSYKLETPPPPDQYFWSVEAYKDGEKIAGSTFEHFTVK